MKILAVSIRIPAVERQGDQTVSFSRLTHLAWIGHSVEVICFGDLRAEDDQLAKQTLEASGIVVHLVQWSLVEAAWRLFEALFSPSMPFQCALYKSWRFSKLVSEVSHRLQQDFIYSVMVRVAPNITSCKGKILVEMVDSMELNFSRRASLAKGLKRWMLNLEKRRVSAFEKALADRAEHSFVVSNIDRQAIGSPKVEAIPLGIDMRRFIKTRRLGDNPILVFTGNMFYQPNVDAVCWFVQHCWARIKQAVPDARLVIAGSNPQPRVVSLSKNDTTISVTGRVPSITDVLHTATVSIAPMQSGSGMQFKILEAMACGVPVITTKLGLGDISALPGKDLLIADNPSEFIEHVLRLICSTDLNQAIGDSGLEYVLRNHSWDAMNQKFVEICGLQKDINT